MTPRTPSRFQHEFSLATPQTPRYGPLEDPDVPRKMMETKYSSHNCDSNTLQVPRGRNLDDDPTNQELINNKSMIVPLTPAETPVNRKRTIEAIRPAVSASRVLFPRTTPVRGSGRAYHSRQTPKSKRTITTHLIDNYSAREQPNFEIFDQMKALKREIDNENPFTPSSSSRASDVKRASIVETVQQRYPHIPMPLDVPGMWYVFRGKKIFRPFPKGDDSLASINPRNLFGSSTDKKTAVSDSEDDTDHEELPPARRKLDFLAAKAIPVRLKRKS